MSVARKSSMPDISQPVPMSFIIETIAAIFAIVGIGILGVKMGKRNGKE